MNNIQTKFVSLVDAKKYIDYLDLTYIVESMCSEDYPLPRWISTEAQHCCKLYKNFLWLNKKYLSEDLKLVPTREIDEFWHNHILYTERYMKDCYHIFGHYFHHAPATPSEDTEKLVHQFQETERLYLEEFNTPLVLVKD